MSTAAGPLTFEEFFELPEDESGEGELLDGEWLHSRLPEQDCNDIATRLFLDLFRFSESLRLDDSCPQIGKVHFAAGYRLGTGSWLKPSVSVAHANQVRGRFYEGAPLVAIEIISASDSAPTIDSKIEKYFQNGAEEVWIFYPGTRRVLTYFAGRDEIEIGREYIRSRVLSEVKTIPLSTIW